MGSLRSVTEFTVRSFMFLGCFCFLFFLFVEMMKMIGKWRIVNGQKVEDSYFVCACLVFEFGFSELRLCMVAEKMLELKE